MSQADTKSASSDAIRRNMRSGPYPRWTTFANGRVYRPVMKLMHRLGWCYPTPALIEPGHVWCHWCGMRGRRGWEGSNK